MNTWLRDSLIGLGLVALGVVVGLTLGQRHEARKAQALQTQSDQHEGAAQTHAALAAVSDQQAKDRQTAILDADARVAAAKRELDRQVRALHGEAPASIEPLPAIPVAVDASAALEKAQEVIAAQDEAIKQRDQVIAALAVSRDQWKAAYEESQKALALQKLASEAAIHSESKRGFLHSLETGAICAALGYAAGGRK